MKEGEKTLCDCGHEAVAAGCTTGYGIKDGKKICFACCGKEDAETLRTTGKLNGYFTYEQEPRLRPKKGYIFLKNAAFGNWPGSFKIPVYQIKYSRNNFRADRYDFWFTWEGRRYWGCNVGDNQCARVKRVKD